MIRFNVITLLCSLSVLQASSTLYLIEECLTKVEPHSVTPYKESLWDTMPTVIRRYMFNFLPEKEVIKLHEVSKDFNDVGNGRNCQDVIIKNRREKVTEEMKIRLKQADVRAMLWLIAHHPFLDSFLYHSARLSIGWGIALSKLFPSSFIHHLYTYPERSAEWAICLRPKSFVDIYTTFLQYNPQGLKNWMLQMYRKKLLCLWLPTLVTCMKKSLEPWQATVLSQELSFTIDSDAMSITALQEVFAKLYSDSRKPLYKWFVEERRVPMRRLSKMVANMIKAKQGRLAKDILCYWFKEHKTKHSLALKQELTEDLLRLSIPYGSDRSYAKETLNMLALVSSLTVTLLPQLASQLD